MGIKNNMYARNTAGLTLAAFGQCVYISLTSMALPMFMTDVMYIAPASVSAIFLLTRIWDAINDPMMGAIVDRTNTKWGKCRPYVLFAALPLFIFTILMFTPFSFKTDSGKFAVAFITYVLFITAYSVLDIPMSGLKVLLFTEPDKRNKASSFSSTFGSLGSLFAIDLFFVMVVLFGGGNDKKGYFVTVLLLSVVAIGMLLAGFFTVREVVPIAPRQSPFFESMKTVLKNKHLRIAILIQLGAIGTSAYGLMLPYFSKWNLADSFSFGSFSVESVLIPILSTATGVFYMIAVMITPYLLRYTTKKKLMLIMACLGAALNVVSLVVGYSNLFLFIGIRILAHIPPSIMATVAGFMVMDCLDYAEYKTGERTEGSTYAVNNLIMLITGAVFSSMIMLLLGLSGYDAEVTTPALEMGESISYNYPGMLKGIFYLMTALPAISLALQIIPICFYKLEGKEFEEVISTIKKMRGSASAKATAAEEAVNA